MLLSPVSVTVDEYITAVSCIDCENDRQILTHVVWERIATVAHTYQGRRC